MKLIWAFELLYLDFDFVERLVPVTLLRLLLLHYQSKVTVIDHYLLKVLVVEERKRRKREREYRLRGVRKGRMKVRGMDSLPKVVVSSAKSKVFERSAKPRRAKGHKIAKLTLSDCDPPPPPPPTPPNPADEACRCALPPFIAPSKLALCCCCAAKAAKALACS